MPIVVGANPDTDEEIIYDITPEEAHDLVAHQHIYHDAESDRINGETRPHIYRLVENSAWADIDATLPASEEDIHEAAMQAAKDRTRPEEHDRWPGRAGWVGAAER